MAYRIQEKEEFKQVQFRSETWRQDFYAHRTRYETDYREIEPLPLERYADLHYDFYTGGDSAFDLKAWPLFSLQPGLNLVAAALKAGQFDKRPRKWPINFEFDWGKRWIMMGGLKAKAVLEETGVCVRRDGHVSTWKKLEIKGADEPVVPYVCWLLGGLKIDPESMVVLGCSSGSRAEESEGFRSSVGKILSKVNDVPVLCVQDITVACKGTWGVQCTVRAKNVPAVSLAAEPKKAASKSISGLGTQNVCRYNPIYIYHAGDAVMTEYLGAWYSAKVVRVCADGTYDIAWGVSEDVRLLKFGLEPFFLRPIPLTRKGPAEQRCVAGGRAAKTKQEFKEFFGDFDEWDKAEPANPAVAARLAVGDRVHCRDNMDKEWKNGEVTQVDGGLKVLADGFGSAFSWRYVEPGPAPDPVREVVPAAIATYTPAHQELQMDGLWNDPTAMAVLGYSGSLAAGTAGGDCTVDV